MEQRLNVRPALALSLVALVLTAVGSIIGLMNNSSDPLQDTIFSAASQSPKPYTFPNGGRTIFPRYRVVALYGTPSYPVLGALGQQDIGASINRVKQLAAEYKPLSTQPILPAFEIITTVASASPTANNDYSQEIDEHTLLPWAQEADTSGVYVVLDLQSGRSDFLTQAEEYQSLLALPNVGLALDPEWRLAPNQIPLVQIGSVSASEINSVASWLARLTSDHHLPQKLFIVHEFRTSMIEDRNELQTNFPDLAYLIQMDGQGTPSEKYNTYSAVTASPPPGVRFGWKNFYQKDTPILTPAQTMAVKPEPWYISYQ